MKQTLNEYLAAREAAHGAPRSGMRPFTVTRATATTFIFQPMWAIAPCIETPTVEIH